MKRHAEKEKEKDTPLGPWRPPKRENPFGPATPRRKPHDPFASKDAGSGAPTERRGKSGRRRVKPRPVEFLIEEAEGGAIAHLPELPGCTFRAGDPVQLHRVAAQRLADYLGWCIDEGLDDLVPRVRELTRLVGDGRTDLIQVAEAERRSGAPLWLSGQPAVLFRRDYRPLDDDTVRAHFRLMRAGVRRVRMRLASVTPAERAWKPAPDRRSLDETLAHMARSVWWLCSRLDDALREPQHEADELLELLGKRIEEAEAHLIGVREAERTRTHRPERYPTADPGELWTHAKVCRRQAEHIWEHLVGLPRAVRAAVEA